MVEITDEQKEILAGLTDSQIDTFQETKAKVVESSSKSKDSRILAKKIIATGKRNKILRAVNDSSEHCWVCDQPILELVESEVN